MNPEIAKYWDKALSAFNAAKTALKNGKSDYEVKKELYMAIFYGQFAIRKLNCVDIAITADIFLDYLSKIEHLGTKQAIDITRKALKAYRNLLPEEDSLPVPPDC